MRVIKIMPIFVRQLITKNIVMVLEDFMQKCKAVRSPKRVQHTGSFSHSRSCGVDYYVYVCTMTFETFNPYTKKHAGRPYKSFFSPVSAEHAKEMAFKYILEQNRSDN